MRLSRKFPAWILSLCAFLLIGCRVACAQTTVWWALTNWNMTLATNNCRVTPVGPPTIQGQRFVIGPGTIYSTTNGFFTNSMAPNPYRLEILGTPYTNIFFAVPNDGLLHNVTDPGMLISGANFYNFTPGVLQLTSVSNTVTINPITGTGNVDIEVGVNYGGGLLYDEPTGAIWNGGLLIFDP